MNDIPLCECGCGDVAPLAPKTVASRGVVKGQPLRFIHGHNRRKSGSEYLIDPITDCWVWQRAITTRSGHGVSYDVRAKQTMSAHRVFYERKFGPVPAGMHLHHKCENPPCVNPDHLEPLSAAAHAIETRSKGAHLSIEIAREIRAAPTGWGTGRALAKKYGTTDQAISNIRAGRTWKEDGRR